MDSIPANPVLQFNPTTFNDIRKCWNLENGRMTQSVDILEEWLCKQNHFVNKKFGRVYLEKTLVACKGSVEKAKSQIDKLCTLKTLLPKYFVGGDVKKHLGDPDIAFVVPLPKLTKEHYRVAILPVKSKEFTSANFMKFYQQSIVMCEYIKAHDYVNGFIVIEDLRDANLMEIITKINFIEFQQFLAILVEGFGARLRGIHLLTHSKVIDLFVKTFKPLLSAKLGDRIHVHQDLKELHSVVDKQSLPVEYGGEEISIDKLKNKWLDILKSEETEKYLEEMKAACTDESLRPSGKFNEQIMGLPGAFRKLNVD